MLDMGIKPITFAIVNSMFYCLSYLKALRKRLFKNCGEKDITIISLHLSLFMLAENSQGILYMIKQLVGGYARTLQQ